MSEQNKTQVRRLVEELWNKGNLQVADELIAPTYTHHDASTPESGRGPEGEKKRVTHYRTAFPDLRLSIEDMFAAGETVVTRWSCRGAHKGDLNGTASPQRESSSPSPESTSASSITERSPKATSTGILWA